MSRDLRAQARGYLAAGRNKEARPILEAVLAEEPDDAEMNLALALVISKEFGLPQAQPLFERAVALRPGDAVALTHYGFALFREGVFSDAKHRFFDAATANPDYDPAHAGLAVCQRELGEFEKAEKNLEGAFHAMARVWAKRARAKNSIESPIYACRVLGANRWVEHATFAAIFLATHDQIGGVALPTSETAEQELSERRYGGLYYEDRRDKKGMTRHILPNFFDSFREWLVGSPTYPGTCHAMRSVLLRLGRVEEADEFGFEGEDFSKAQPLAPTSASQR